MRHVFKGLDRRLNLNPGLGIAVLLMQHHTQQMMDIGVPGRVTRGIAIHMLCLQQLAVLVAAHRVFDQ